MWRAKENENRSSRTHLVISFSGVVDGLPFMQGSSSTLELLKLMRDGDDRFGSRRGVGWEDVDQDASCWLDGGVVQPLLLFLVGVEVVMIEDTVGRNDGHLERKGEGGREGRERWRRWTSRERGRRTSPSLDSLEKTTVIFLLNLIFESKDEV